MPATTRLFVVLALLGSALVLTPGIASANRGHDDFVRRDGPELRLDGHQFRFAGSNQYYLMYKSPFMVDDVLQTAATQGFDVMRVWGSLDVGDPNDNSTSIAGGPKEGVYLHYWDVAAQKPAFNDGANGLQRLDYIVAKAGQLGLKLVIPFVNNWNDFGGIDQYVRWRDLSSPGVTRYHDTFYTDRVIRGWYRDWISHLLNHTNSLTGVKYKNDPTIMTWELANEPRCKSAGAYDVSPACNTSTLTRWADEMSTYVKSIDRNHLVSVGDEGFYCHPGASDWTDNCGEGVDTEAFTRLPNVDVMSFHLYPDSWGMTADWGTSWIKSHFAAARRIGKPAMLGEFGLKDKSVRNPVYKTWLDSAFWSGGTGALYWLLSGKQDDGSLYPDYDGFTVYCPSPVCTTISNFGKQMDTGFPIPFAPVADVDTATTPFQTPVTVPAVANDISYFVPLLPRTLDLDPSTPGQQTTLTVAGGTFTAGRDGSVTFVPNTGFFGVATATYIVRDLLLRPSNVATITVTVNRPITPTVHLFSFEGSTEGWQSGGGAGTLTTTNAWSTDGSSSLEINVTGDGWFGGVLTAPVDVSQKTALKLDLQTLGAQTYRKISIQVGDGFTWCEASDDGNTPPNTVETVIFDFSRLTCSGADLTKLQQVNIYLQGGTFRIDNVRVD